MTQYKLFGIGLLGLMLLGAGCSEAITEEVTEIVMDEEGGEHDGDDATGLDGSFTVDLGTSTAVWTGVGVGKEHTGTIDMSAGDVIFIDGDVGLGYFTFDMTSIVSTDLENETLRENLDIHLKGDDFFGADTFPEATFDLASLVMGDDGAYTVTGTLTVRDNANDVSFAAELVENEAGYSLVGTAEVDRAKYDVKYGSDSFFDNLGDNLIDDIFTLELDLQLDRDEPVVIDLDDDDDEDGDDE